ncbi:MAG: tetratricopeptide repeat protein [Vicinamibacterales bacterium]
MNSSRLPAALLVLGILGAQACSRGETPDEAMRRGDALFAQKRYRPAAQAYRAVVAAQPGNEAARAKLGEALAEAGDPVRAADVLPNDVKVQVDAAIARQGKFRFDDARTIANRVLETEPDNARALVVLADATAMLPNTVWPMQELAERLGNPDRFEGLRRDARPPVTRANDQRAEQLYKRALERQPDLLDARLAYSNFLWTTGRRAESEAHLRAAAEQAPDHTVANFVIGALYVSMNRLDEALPFLDRARQGEGPGRRSATLLIADRDLRTGAADEAHAMLESMLETDDQEGDVSMRLASLEVRMGRPADAARRLTRLLERKPGLGPAQIMRARLLYEQGNPDQRFVRQALQLDSQSSEAHLLLGRLLADAGQTDEALDEYGSAARSAPGDVRPLLALARMSLEEGRVPQAVSHARAAVRLAPGDKDAGLTLVSALIAVPDLDAAGATLAPLAAALPNDPEVAITEGRLALARGNAGEARAAFTRALAVRDDLHEALDGLVTAEGAQPTPATLHRVESAAQAHPSDPDLRLLVGRMYRAMRDLPRAEAALTAAQQLNPTHVPVALALASVLREQQKTDAAAAALERVLVRRPARIADVRVALANLYLDLGRQRDAQKQYEQLVVELPGAPQPAMVLASMYLDQKGDLTRALELALVAKRSRPMDSEVDLLLGRIYNEKGQGSLAVVSLQQAVNAKPDNALYHFHLGAAFELSGSLSKARVEYARALQLDPNVPGAEKARQMTVGRR